MKAPLQIEAALSRPSLLAGEEPVESVHALVRLSSDPAVASQPRLDFCFLLDASASMYHFQLTQAERAHWMAVAVTRGDVEERIVDGRAAAVWGGQTLRELGEQVSTPMHCALRGLWRGIASLAPADPISVVAFADTAVAILEDPGQSNREERLAAARGSLERLTSGASQAGIGHNSRLVDALRMAVSRCDVASGSDIIRRAVLVSDGQVVDRDECFPWLEAALDRDLVISAVGVGEEFDEEFLMRVADETRGRYYYAPTARDLEGAMAAEFASMRRGIARQVSVSVSPASEGVLQGVYQVRPELARFPVMWVSDAGATFRLGNLAAGADVELLISMAPPALPPPDASLARVRVTGLPIGEDTPFEADVDVRAVVTPEPALANARDDRVMDVVMRLEAFLEERRAQAARERGDRVAATRHLQAATRIIRSLGDGPLAAEMEAEAAALASADQDQGRTKRIKVGTRRLAEIRPRQEAT